MKLATIPPLLVEALRPAPLSLLVCAGALLLVGAAPVTAQFAQPSYAATQTFLDDAGLQQTRMGITFDGTDYWSCSGGNTSGDRIAQYDSNGTFLARYAPGLDLRSVFTLNDSPPVYCRAFSNAIIREQTAPGVFSSHVTLSGGSLNSQSSVSFNDAGEYIAMNNGTVSRWDANGTFVGSISLGGFGGMNNEGSYPQNRGIAFLGGFYLTYANGTLSAWDANGTRAGTTVLTGAGTSFDSHFSFSVANGMAWVVDSAGGMWRGYDVGLGLGCNMVAPPNPAAGDVPIQVDAYSGNANTVDLTWESSLDAGVTYNPCTPAGGSPNPNPANGVPVGVQDFLWDSVADQVGQAVVATGVLVKVTVADGIAPVPGLCTSVPFDVDNRPPAPTCTLTVPAGIQSLDIELALDSDSVNAATVTATFEYSENGGGTWSPCTAAGVSAIPNPAPGIPTGPATFTWASRTDGVGLGAVVPGVLVRALLDDGVSPIIGECTTPPFDVDNTALCGHACGDCNLDSSGPDIIDGLTAAQIAALIVTPLTEQTGCCDVNTSGGIDIIDALLIAQVAAQLPVSLVCP